MCRLPLMTVQPCSDWAASTESIVLVSQTLSHSPSHALQNILQVGERKREKKGEWASRTDHSYTHRLQTRKRQWTVTGLLCLTKTQSIFKACFWQTQGHCFMRSLRLTESSLEPWVLCVRGIIKLAVRQNQVWSIYKTGSTSKKLRGKVNEVILLLIFYLKSTGVQVKSKVW